MWFLRLLPPFPRNPVLRLSPWLIVGSALILGLAIAFWAVKNAQLERASMTRNLLDRSGALIWAVEGSVRAGMGMRISARHLQFMLEETARQPGIAYMAVATQEGLILAHSDRTRIGDVLYPPEAMATLSPTASPGWRVLQEDKAGSVFEVYKLFAPLPGFREHMRHGGMRGERTDWRRDAPPGERRGWRHDSMREDKRGRHGGRHRRMHAEPEQRTSPCGNAAVEQGSAARPDSPMTALSGSESSAGASSRSDAPEASPSASATSASAPEASVPVSNTSTPALEASAPASGASGSTPGASGSASGAVPSSPSPESAASPDTPGGTGNFKKRLPIEDASELVIFVGLGAQPFEARLASDLRGTIFTALLVGLLGIGGLLSLFWAQSCKLSRRMVQDIRAFAGEVVSSLPLGLVIFNPAGQAAHGNAAAAAILGMSEKAIQGKTAAELGGRDWEEIAARVNRGEAALEEEHTLAQQVEAENGPLPVSISASRIINEEGQALGMIFLLRDLREVKRLQEQLRRSERLSTLGNMAARVAHEIRNPLSSIKGFATFLGSRRDNPEDKEAARIMIGEVDRLNRVVSELLDFARPSKLRIAPFSLQTLLLRALRLAEPDAAARGVLLVPPVMEKDLTVAVDGERLTQALLNLCINAVQATGEGGSLSISVAPPERGTVAITLTDTGRGMPPELLSRIFAPYFTTKASGTGLGLAIVQKIVEDHKGDISIVSQEGRGTSVTLRLPLWKEEDAAPSQTLAGASHE